MTDMPAIAATDATRAIAKILLPMAAGGAIARRPTMMRMVDRLNLDAGAIDEMRRLRSKYGPGPVQITPGRRLALVLDPDDVHHILNNTPEPFRPDTKEKRGALEHFQPEGVLISTPEERLKRRPLNEAALQTRQPVHDHAATMSAAIEAETEALLGHVDFAGGLSWRPFAIAWWRMVRQITLGASARDDTATTDGLLRLRQDANTSYLKPTRKKLRARVLASIQDYVERAEPGSLAQMVATVPAEPGVERHQQVPQWLFAFDAAAWATMRALALVSNSPEVVTQLREELAGADQGRPDLPYSRAVILESLRLFSTTPLVLRETTTETEWASGTLPPQSSLVIFAPFFHRDPDHLAEADSFAPELWMRERTDADWPLVPFSGGPGMCPGRNVVLMVSSLVLSRLVSGHDFSGREFPAQRIPPSLDPFSLRFRATRRA
ncbi:cytochrome P450 [Bogoriella caseilytica]|uniref:Cytochrome P450 n=1 Tax=Bogoriella caseilytica TaxID=56055 RepID=A0A3N2BBC1_9MICO|nr:cytochrome P450 [Bogoriella caseilytica]ROR72528.1 cytochrome P450 [Bogoriella caseilytica]